LNFMQWSPKGCARRERALSQSSRAEWRRRSFPCCLVAQALHARDRPASWGGVAVRRRDIRHWSQDVRTARLARRRCTNAIADARGSGGRAIPPAHARQSTLPHSSRMSGSAPAGAARTAKSLPLRACQRQDQASRTLQPAGSDLSWSRRMRFTRTAA
jgi:hypothetical protein